MKVVNYRHPLTDAGKERLVELAGEPVEIIEIDGQAQIDFDALLLPQLDALVYAGREADVIIPPALSTVAAYVATRLAMWSVRKFKPLGIVVMRSESAGIGSVVRFMPVEIVSLTSNPWRLLTEDDEAELPDYDQEA